MTRYLARLLVACLAFAATTSAHDVITTPITFSREISRLLYRSCASCHHEGGSAFPLLTYEQARPWAKAIKEEVLERRMPPWGAVKGFGEFKEDQSLTQEQIELIADWVEGGAPEGDPKLLPKSPEFHAASVKARVERAITVAGALVLKTAADVTGIRPTEVPEGVSSMVIAARPDGSIEPMLWLYNYKSAFARTFWYRSVLRLPTGTRIEVAPPAAGSFALYTRPPAKP